MKKAKNFLLLFVAIAITCSVSLGRDDSPPDKESKTAVMKKMEQNSTDLFHAHQAVAVVTHEIGNYSDFLFSKQAEPCIDLVAISSSGNENRPEEQKMTNHPTKEELTSDKERIVDKHILPDVKTHTERDKEINIHKYILTEVKNYIQKE